VLRARVCCGRSEPRAVSYWDYFDGACSRPRLCLLLDPERSFLPRSFTVVRVPSAQPPLPLPPCSPTQPSVCG
jgi:hypothetical protein